MAVVYGVIVTSSNIHFLGIESCEKREILGLKQHALLTMRSYQNCMEYQSNYS